LQFILSTRYYKNMHLEYHNFQHLDFHFTMTRTVMKESLQINLKVLSVILTFKGCSNKKTSAYQIFV